MMIIMGPALKSDVINPEYRGLLETILSLWRARGELFHTVPVQGGVPCGMARASVKPEGTHAVPRSRPHMNQIMVGLVLLSMGVLIIYMYRIIDDLHNEQKDLRTQITKMATREWPPPWSSQMGRLELQTVNDHSVEPDHRLLKD
eukprot:Skav201022  [mRNA]  locus=scaffold604:36910:43582:- [translate_table: standard]